MAGNTTHSILRATYESLQLGGLPDPPVERVATGEELVYVSLGRDDGHPLAGVSHAAGSDYPDVTGRRASSLVEQALAADASLGDRTLGVATLNALSAGRVDWESGDPMDQLGDRGAIVGMVGLFTPALHKFRDVDIEVIERFPEDVDQPSDLPPGVTINIHGPANAGNAFDEADVVFVTGSTLVYGGLGGYLERAPETATLVVLGATSSFVPEHLFEAGVDIVGGVEVTDQATIAAHTERGTPAADLHGNGLRKGLITAADES